MGMIKVYIVEDEPLIAEDLAANLEDLGYAVTGMADNALDAMADLASNPPDVALLDINLEGDTDGVDLAAKIKEKYGLPFIFVTSHADKGTIERVKATGPAGFIVKPFDERDLRSNIEIALFRHSSALNAADEHETPNTDEEFVISDSIFVKDKGKLVKVSFASIRYAEAYDNYTNLFTDTKKYLVSATLKSVEQKLNDPVFLRVHRSYLINIDKVDSLKDGYVHVAGQSIPVGKTHKDELMARIRTL